MIDYFSHFNLINTMPSVFDSYQDKKKFIELFYQFLIPNQAYPVKCKIFDENPFIVDLANEMGREIFIKGFIEDKLSYFLYNNISPGDVFIDGGAHQGYFSKIAAIRMADQGSIIAFEPTPTSIKTFQMNHHDTPIVRLFKKALSGDGLNKKLCLFGNGLSPYNTIKSNNRIQSETVIKPTEIIDVKSITLSEVLDDLVGDVPSDNMIWIKLDIEGAELEVLQSSIQTIADRNCTIIAEAGIDQDNTIELIKLLSDNNFTVFVFKEFNLTPVTIDTELLMTETLCLVAKKTVEIV